MKFLRKHCSSKMVYVNCSQTLPVWNEKCWLYIEWQHFYIIILFLRLFVCLLFFFYYCCLLLVNKVAYSITFCNQSYISPLYEIKTNIQFIHTSGLHLSLYCITPSVQNVPFHPRMPHAWSLLRYSSIAPPIMLCHERQSSAVSGRPSLELASNTHDPAPRPIFDSQFD